MINRAHFLYFQGYGSVLLTSVYSLGWCAFVEMERRVIFSEHVWISHVFNIFTSMQLLIPTNALCINEIYLLSAPPHSILGHKVSDND